MATSASPPPLPQTATISNYVPRIFFTCSICSISKLIGWSRRITINAMCSRLLGCCFSREYLSISFVLIFFWLFDFYFLLFLFCSVLCHFPFVCKKISTKMTGLIRLVSSQYCMNLWIERSVPLNRNLSKLQISNVHIWIHFGKIGSRFTTKLIYKMWYDSYKWHSVTT